MDLFHIYCHVCYQKQKDEFISDAGWIYQILIMRMSKKRMIVKRAFVHLSIFDKCERRVHIVRVCVCVAIESLWSTTSPFFM